MWSRVRVGSWPSRLGTPRRRGCKGCSPMRCGTPTPSATTCAASHRRAWRSRRRSDLGRHRRFEARRTFCWCAKAVHRYCRSNRERAGVDVPGLRQPTRSGADRPGGVSTQSWTDDRDRCRAAGVPDEVGFATKVTHGRRMIGRALDAGLPAAWVTADEFYGTNQANRVTPPAAPSSDKSRPAWQKAYCVGLGGRFHETRDSLHDPLASRRSPRVCVALVTCLWTSLANCWNGMCVPI
jgi:hypothetical protein